MDRMPEKIDSKFRLVLLAAQRAEQMMRGGRPKIEMGDLKPTRVALDLAQLEASWEEHGELFPKYLEALQHCLAELDRREQAAVEQRYRLGWSRQRIGEALGLSTDGVKSLLQRIRNRLRHRIERTLEENER